MNKNTQALMEVGFSAYEALAYCALLEQSPANGYQIAQRSGVPRAKIYECLERLLSNGAVVRVDGPDVKAAQFAPIDYRQLLHSIAAANRSACERAMEVLERYRQSPRQMEVLWRVTSEQDLISRGRSLVREATQTLHVALWGEEFDELLPDLQAALERGVKLALVLYSQRPGLRLLKQQGGNAVQHSRTKRLATPIMGRQFVLAADRQQGITGSIFDDGVVEGIFSWNRGLVTNAVDLVNHEIYVERIVSEIGEPVLKRFGAQLERLKEFGD